MPYSKLCINSFNLSFVCKLSNNKYNLGKTSLMYAAAKGYDLVIGTLSDNGADINEKDNNG